MAAINLQAIPVLAELSRYGFEEILFGAGDNVQIKCPFHDDTNPSCSVNVQTREFKCHTAGCEKFGDIVTLLARKTGQARATILLDLARRYDINDEKTIDPVAVERWHEAIWKADALRNELYRRGITDDIIRRRRLGVVIGKEPRITIPIPNVNGVWVNVKKYLPGAPGAEKMKNTAGYGKVPRWYPVDQLRFDTLVMFGGEMKALVGLDELNGYSIGSISLPYGEKSLPSSLLEDLRGKVVYICMDIDEAGQNAVRKHATTIRMVAERVFLIELPLERDKFPKGDINDYVMLGNAVRPLLDTATEYIHVIEDKLKIDTSDPEEMQLNRAVHADNSGKRLMVKGVISAMDTTPYLLPREVAITCMKDQEFCAGCPVYAREQNIFTIPPESSTILDFIEAPTSIHQKIAQGAIGIPHSCNAFEYEKLTEYNVEDTRISPQLEVTNRFGDMQPVPAYCIGTGLSLNECYNFTGKLIAHPKTQQATLLISEHKPSKDALSEYVLEAPETLGAFWPTEWSVEAIDAKLQSIYDDFTYNVTHVRGRNDMHFAVDLLYHSPLLINFDGRFEKGWIDVLIIGDSSVGKSQCLRSLVNHYDLGYIAEASNSTAAGILGSMEKMNERFFVSWGLLPTHDQRAVFIEEFSKIPEDVLSRIRYARFEGVAKITKAGRNYATNCRVRLGVVSNCQNDLEVCSYPFGVHAVKELLGGTPDIRRFDLAIIATNIDVPRKLIDAASADLPQVEHVYTSALCRKLVLWAWTRNRDQVHFTPEAITSILKYASELSTKFSEAIPLVDTGSMRYKLARLAASLAARLFSCSEDYESLIVYECHVEYIVQFLERIYCAPTFAYDAFSKAQQIQSELLSPDQLEIAILETAYPKDLCRSMLAQDFIEQQDIADWTGVNGEASQSLVSLFMRKHAIIRRGKYYRKTPLFIDMLKRLAGDEAVPDVGEPKEEGRF